MCNILEILGKGLEAPLMEMILPHSLPLQAEDAILLQSQLTEQPDHTANTLRLAIHYAQSHACEQAVELFEQILAQKPGQTDAALAWAAMYCDQGNPEKALTVLQHHFNDDATDGRVLFAFGYCLELLEETDKALYYYQNAQQARPLLKQPIQRCAAICYLKENLDDAIWHCQTYQNQYPEDIWIYLVLGELSLQKDDSVKARDYFERALTIEPDNFELHDDYVESLAQSGQIAEAILEMHKIIDKQGAFPDSYARLAELYTQIDDDEAAIRNYRIALELHPGYLEAAVKLGTQHLRMGRYLEAAKMFNQSVEINDNLITAYAGLAVAQEQSGQLEAARDTYDLALALEPNTNLLFAETARLQLKVSLHQKQNPDYLSFENNTQAETKVRDDLLNLQIERVRQACMEAPGRADLHYRYAILLRGKGQVREAVQHLTRAVEINPSFSRAQVKLGLALLEIGDHGLSQEHFRKAFESDSEQVALHYKLGLLYCDKIQFALAVEECENNPAESLETVDVQANLMLALQNMGLVNRAAASWRGVCELEPQSVMAFQAQRSQVSYKPVF
jgi:Tfp pilus assembly protein PilF